MPVRRVVFRKGIICSDGPACGCGPSLTAPDGGAYHPSMYRVLIVDDEAEFRSAFAAYYPWSELGFVVAGQASTAEEARGLLEAESVDAIVCDIRMPGGSGLELAAWVRGERPGVKVVMLSAYRKFEYAQEAIRCGVRSYLVKPPAMEDFRELFGVIRSELDEERKAAADPGDPVVRSVREFARGNLGAATLETAAAAVGMSPTYLCTYFREKTGEHYSDFLSRLRMEKAAKLLTERLWSVIDVARETGYSNPKNFSRAFKKYYGSSPREYLRPAALPAAQPGAASTDQDGRESGA
jgi:two-component system, response regulator YesN